MHKMTLNLKPTKSLLLLLIILLLGNIEAVERSEVTYYLFNEQSPQTYIEVDTSNIGSHIDKNAETVFLVHGWTESRQVQWYEELKNAYLTNQTKKYNIIQVDWSGPASKKYTESASNARIVGQYLAEFMADLVGNIGLLPENFHIIGHSLGGQVAGFTGKSLIRIKNSKVGRITALDPAGPLFTGILVGDDNRLHRFDADVVLVIHTDSGLFSFGYLGACGTVDVFVNGGTRPQPGCPWPAKGLEVFCSHQRSCAYFIEAVKNPRSLMATKCLSYPAFLWGMCTEAKTIDIGGTITQNDAGLYYLTTNSQQPFGKANQ